MTVASSPDRSALATLLGQWFLLVSAGLAWGVSFSLAKIATQGGAHPIGLNFWQALIGTVFVSIYVVFRRRTVDLSRAHIVFYTVCGIFGTAIPGTLYFYAAAFVPAGVLAITIATVPLMTFVAGLAFGIERAILSRFRGDPSRARQHPLDDRARGQSAGCPGRTLGSGRVRGCCLLHG